MKIRYYVTLQKKNPVIFSTVSLSLVNKNAVTYGRGNVVTRLMLSQCDVNADPMPGNAYIRKILLRTFSIFVNFTNFLHLKKKKNFLNVALMPVKAEISRWKMISGFSTCFGQVLLNCRP